MRHGFTFYSLFLAAVLGAAALLAGVTLYRDRAPDWTIAFYLDGSGNLLAEQQKNLREIIAGCAGLRDIQVLVCLDRGPSPSFPMSPAWTGSRIFHINGNRSQILSRPVIPGLPESVEASRFTGLMAKDLPQDVTGLFEQYYTLKGNRYHLTRKSLPPDHETIMTEALKHSGYLFTQSSPEPAKVQSLSRFFSLVRDRYPSHHYAFVVTGHGLGWFSGANPVERQGSFNAAAIQQGLTFNEPDILCLDLCFMADLASLFQLKDSAQYLIMSQGPAPASGQNYTALFETIKAQTSLSPETMAALFHASAAHSLEKSRLNSAVSLFKTGPELDAFFTGISHVFGDGNIRQRMIQNDVGFIRLPRWGGVSHHMIDLKPLLQEFSSIAVSDVMTNVFSTSDKASGLSIFYPADHLTYVRLRKDYNGLDIVKEEGASCLTLLDEKYGPQLKTASNTQ